MKDDFTFKEENLSGKRKEDIREKRIVCEKFKCNKYKIFTEFASNNNWYGTYFRKSMINFNY